MNLLHIIYAVVCLVCLFLPCGKREAAPVGKRKCLSSLRHLGKCCSRTVIFLFLLNDLRLFLTLIHVSKVRVLYNSDYGSILWQSVPLCDQKELSKQMRNEEFRLQR